jgi:integrase
MPLTDVAIRNAKPKEKPYKLADGGGLFLLISPSGGKWWRFKYRWLAKEQLLSLGTYPDISLSEARSRHAQARKTLAAGQNPNDIRKEEKLLQRINAENSFEAIAREWHENRKAKWTERYAHFVLKRLEADIFPKIGSRPITDITAPELLTALRVIEKRGALEIANRALKACGQIFMYAVATCRAERNIAADLQGALKTPVKTNYAHLKDVELPEFVEKLNAYEGELQTKLAVKLLMLTFVRTTELRGAQWSEIDFEKAEWRIPASRMKMRRPHIVPLSQQALEALNQLKAFNGRWQFVFPNQVKPIKCMSENTVLFALYSLSHIE